MGTDDEIRLTNGWTSFAQVQANSTYNGFDTFIFIDANTTIQLVGVNSASITAADFVFG